MISRTIEEITAVINEWHGPIVVAYSGGKDSSAVLKLVYSSLRQNARPLVPVSIVYCDTLVENPILDRFVKKTLRALTREARALSVPLVVNVLRPERDQRYFAGSSVAGILLRQPSSAGVRKIS